MSKNYTDLYTYDEWLSLIEGLKGVPGFKQTVRSSPGDTLRNVFTITLKEDFDNNYDYTAKIAIIVVEGGVHIENMSNNNKILDRLMQCAFETPLDQVPLYINDGNEVVRYVAYWRLANNL